MGFGQFFHLVQLCQLGDDQQMNQIKILKWELKTHRRCVCVVQMVAYLQEFTKVWTACGQNDSMCLQASTITGQCNVDKVLVIA